MTPMILGGTGRTDSRLDFGITDMTIETYTANIPEHLASYAMYGEGAGDESESAYDEWVTATMAHEGFESMHLVDVPEEGNGFMSYHDLKDYGVGSCDSCDFVYHVTRKAES